MAAWFSGAPLLLAAFLLLVGAPAAEAACSGTDKQTCEASSQNCEFLPPATFGGISYPAECREKPISAPKKCCQVSFGTFPGYMERNRCNYPAIDADAKCCQKPAPQSCSQGPSKKCCATVEGYELLSTCSKDADDACHCESPAQSDCAPVCCQSYKSSKYYTFKRSECPRWAKAVHTECPETAIAKKYDSMADAGEWLQSQGVFQVPACGIGIGLALVVVGGFLMVVRRNRAQRGAVALVPEDVGLTANEQDIE